MKPIFGPKPSERTDVHPIPDRAHHADWLEAGFHDTCYTLPCRAGMYITQDNNQLWTRGSLRNMLVYATWPMGINRRLEHTSFQVVSDAGEVQKEVYIQPQMWPTDTMTMTVLPWSRLVILIRVQCLCLVLLCPLICFNTTRSKTKYVREGNL